MMIQHYWTCPKCDYDIDFRQPELSEDDWRSEANEDKTCPECNTEMYFEEHVAVTKLVEPT